MFGFEIEVAIINHSRLLSAHVKFYYSYPQFTTEKSAEREALQVDVPQEITRRGWGKDRIETRILH